MAAALSASLTGKPEKALSKAAPSITHVASAATVALSIGGSFLCLLRPLLAVGLSASRMSRLVLGLAGADGAVVGGGMDGRGGGGAGLGGIVIGVTVVLP